MKALFALFSVLVLCSAPHAFAADPGPHQAEEAEDAQGTSPDCDKPGSPCTKNFSPGRISPTPGEAKAKADSLLGGAKPNEPGQGKSKGVK